MPVIIRKYELRWTEQVIANGVAPDTDTPIPLAYCKYAYIWWDTYGCDTGTPNFDFHLYSSYDGTNLSTTEWMTAVNGVAKDVRNGQTINVGAPFIKARLDVNAANLAATEYVSLFFHLVMDY